MNDVELTFNLPDENTPGFLKRQRALMNIQANLTANPGSDAVDGLVDFILPFVVTPADLDVARDLLEDLSQTQLTDILQRLATTQASPKV